MSIRRRRSLVIGCAAALAALPCASGFAQEKFPSRPIEIIVPTPPGGGTDIAVRLIGELAEPILGQKIVVVNKPGGGGMIGMAQITQAKPDGYTLGGLWNAPLTMTPHSQPAPYKPTDYAPISLLDSAPTVFCVKKEFPAASGKEFIEHLRKNPGKFTYGNDGIGGTVHLSAERVFLKLGVKARAVPFGGAGETIKNYLGGHVDIYGGSIPPILPYVKDGSTKCLMVSSTETLASMPQAANLAELGAPDAATVLWHGIVGPKGIPADRFAILEKAFQQAARADKFRQYMESRGIKVEGSTGTEFRKLIDAEYLAMAEVVKAIGLKK